MSPFPWTNLLGYLALRLTPGIEAVSGVTYVRTTANGAVTVTFEAGEVTAASEQRGRATADEVERVESIFRQHEDWSAPEAFQNDPVLAPLVRRVPGFRPLGCWEGFELCLRTLVGQQVSVAAAGTLMKRLGNRAGGWTPQQIARADLANLGMPGKRIATIRTLAERAASGDLPWNSPWPDLREALARVPGIGPWTLGYLGIRLGCDLDAFPSSDLGLLRGAGCRTPKELAARAEAWRPYRGWAASYLWMS